MPAKAKKKKAGRPRLPDAEKVKSVHTTVQPELYRWLESLGNGSASRGLRMAVERAKAAG